jgi:hypothetical protein
MHNHTAVSTEKLHKTHMGNITANTVKKTLHRDAPLPASRLHCQPPAEEVMAAVTPHKALEAAQRHCAVIKHQRRRKLRCLTCCST